MKGSYSAHQTKVTNNCREYSGMWQWVDFFTSVPRTCEERFPRTGFR